MLALVRNNVLDLSNLKHFVLDECDQMLEQPGGSSLAPSRPVARVFLLASARFTSDSALIGACSFSPDMRADVQQIFMKTPHEKQVMMFSATLSKDIRPTCKRFMQDVITSPQPSHAAQHAPIQLGTRTPHALSPTLRRLRSSCEIEVRPRRGALLEIR